MIKERINEEEPSVHSLNLNVFTPTCKLCDETVKYLNYLASKR